jgi:outer membrane protein
MKRLTQLASVVIALTLALTFAQCSGGATQTTTPNSPSNASEGSAMKIAYVEIDTLLLKYNFWNDVNEEMIKREENVRATLTEQSRTLEKEAQEFQKKYETNAFVSQERAQQEYARITKKQQDLQALQQRLTDELTKEQQKNSLIMRDSINSFLKEYNKTHGYSLIITNTNFDNLLYADPQYNITKEIIEGLNARYMSTKKK